MSRPQFHRQAYGKDCSMLSSTTRISRPGTTSLRFFSSRAPVNISREISLPVNIPVAILFPNIVRNNEHCPPAFLSKLPVRIKMKPTELANLVSLFNTLQRQLVQSQLDKSNLRNELQRAKSAYDDAKV